ncbi:MAG: S41 family peptidase [Bacteroidota bacterium]
MIKTLASIFFSIVFLVSSVELISQHPESFQEFNPYDKNLRRVDEMIYILSSKWTETKEDTWESYIATLNTAGFDFTADESRFLRYTTDSILLEEGFSLHTYKTSSKKEWIYLIEHEDSEALTKHYQKYRDLWKGKRAKGMGGMGENGNPGKDKGFGQFITFQTGNELSTINLYIRSADVLLVMGMDLDFPIKGKRDELSREQAVKVRDAYNRLQILLDTFSDHFIDESEWLKKPLRGKKLTSEQRLYGFTQFWTEVKYNFAFFDQVPDLDWDQVLYEYLPLFQKDQSNEEYYDNLKLICAKLGDGHTNIYPPREEKDWPGIQLKNFYQKAYVVNVKEEFAEKIPLGSELISVEGMSTENYLKTKVFPYISSSTDHIRYNWGIRDMLDGKPETEVLVEFKTPDGNTIKQNLRRNSDLGGDWVRKGNRRGLFKFERTEGDFAHVQLNGFSREQIIEEFEKRIDSIKSCKGVIIDLRGNGGGSSGIGYAILNHFSKKPYKGSQWRTREHRASFKAWGQFVDADKPLEELSEWNQRARLTAEGNYWHVAEPSEYKSEVKDIIKLPLVVLIGNNTASAAEDFLVALDQLKIAKLIGSPTFGSTGQPLMMDLPGGARARICTKRDTYPDGREFVGYGIQPDFKVEQSVEEYLNEKDVVLEYAINYLKENPDFAKGK